MKPAHRSPIVILQEPHHILYDCNYSMLGLLTSTQKQHFCLVGHQIPFVSSVGLPPLAGNSPCHYFAPCKHCGNLIWSRQHEKLKLGLAGISTHRRGRKVTGYLVSRGMLLLSSQLSCVLPGS